MDDQAKWIFICFAVIAIAAAAGSAAKDFSSVNAIKREAVLLGYATDGPDGFKWKEPKGVME